MLSINNLFFEGKGLRYTGAALSGLGGLYSAGGAVGAYQALQKTQYGKQIARHKGDAKEELEHQKAYPGRSVGKSILGSIPVVGAYTNYRNQVGLEKQKEELEKLVNQKKK